jgi:hypothetical protein
MNFNPMTWFDTVESVLSDFEKKVVRLGRIAEKRVAKAIRNERNAAARLIRAKANRADAERATNAAAKIKELTN